MNTTYLGNGSTRLRKTVSLSNLRLCEHLLELQRELSGERCSADHAVADAREVIFLGRRVLRRVMREVSAGNVRSNVRMENNGTDLAEENDLWWNEAANKKKEVSAASHLF